MYLDDLVVTGPPLSTTHTFRNIGLQQTREIDFGVISVTKGVAEGAVNNSTGHLVKGQQCQTSFVLVAVSV